MRRSGSRLSVADALGILAALESQNSGRVRCLKDSSGKKSYRVSLGGRTYFVKDYRHCSLFESLRHLSCRSLAARSLVGSEILRKAGIDTPIAECVVERRRFIAGRSVFIAEFCDFEPLDRYLHRARPTTERGALARDLARLVARLHAGGLFHRDLTSSNLLARNIHGQWQIHLVDLDSLKLKRLSLADRIENLAQLNCSFLDLGRVTVRDRLLFLDEYLRHVPSLGPNRQAAKRKLLASIAERTRRMTTKPGRRFSRERVPAGLEPPAPEERRHLRTGTTGTKAG